VRTLYTLALLRPGHTIYCYTATNAPLLILRVLRTTPRICCARQPLAHLLHLFTHHTPHHRARRSPAYIAHPFALRSGSHSRIQRVLFCYWPLCGSVVPRDIALFYDTVTLTTYIRFTLRILYSASPLPHAATVHGWFTCRTFTVATRTRTYLIMCNIVCVCNNINVMIILMTILIVIIICVILM